MSSNTKYLANRFTTPNRKVIELESKLKDGHEVLTPPTKEPRSNSPYILESNYHLKLLPKCEGSCSYSTSYLRQISSLEQYVQTLLKIQISQQNTIKILEQKLKSNTSVRTSYESISPTKKEAAALIMELNVKISEILQENSQLKQELETSKQYSQKLLVQHRQSKAKWELEVESILRETNFLKAELQSYANKQSFKNKSQPLLYDVGIQYTGDSINSQELKKVQAYYLENASSFAEKYEKQCQNYLELFKEMENKLEKCYSFINQLQLQRSNIPCNPLKQSKIIFSKQEKLKGEDDDHIEEEGHAGFIVNSRKEHESLPIIRAPTIHQQLKPAYRVIETRTFPVNFAYTNGILSPIHSDLRTHEIVRAQPLEQSQEICKLRQLVAEKDMLIQTLERNIQMQRSRKSLAMIQPSPIPESFYQELQTIRMHLLSCNPSNYQQFFQDMEKIVQERNQMRDQIKQLKELASPTYYANYYGVEKELLHEKQANSTLRNKLELSEQSIQGLNCKIEQLEDCLQKIKSSDLYMSKKLIKSQSNQRPVGYDALEWQKAVRSCIDDTLIRLESLELKIKSESKGKESSILYFDKSHEDSRVPRKQFVSV